MIAGWQVKPLGEICTIKPPKAEARAKLTGGDDVSFAPMEDLGIGVKYLKPQHNRRLDEVSGSYTYFADGDVLLAKITPCFENGKLGVARGLTNGIGFGSSEYIVLRPAAMLDAEFLYYYLARPEFLEEGARSMTGAVGHKRVAKEFIANYPFPLPPLREQRSIVAILDEAFESIATAKANAEKNWRNARELFESHLEALLKEGGHGWAKAPIAECFKIRSGDFLPAKSMASEGDIPVYGGNGVAGSHDASNLSGEQIVIGRVGAKCGNVRYICGDIWLTDNAFHVSKYLRPFSPTFLARVLNFKNLRQTANQATQPVISYTTIKDVMLSFPINIDTQSDIAVRLNKLEEHVDRVESIYERKLSVLDQLRKSLLHQAFTGQLTSAKPTRAAAQPTLQTTTPEFAANVISIAYARHKRQQREKTFGRVKVQKVLHLAESIAKIDMGRQPIRDAAGPNDFQHMLKAEEWARAHNFFEMVKRDGGYDFKKLSAFDEHLSRARLALAPYLPQLESAIDILVPMDKKEVEVFATVHSAWNNLLIDGVEVTDGEIISAAREGWHADKLDIPEGKFQEAIALIRHKGLVPDGTAKYVGGQQRLI